MSAVVLMTMYNREIGSVFKTDKNMAKKKITSVLIKKVHKLQ